MNATIGFIGGGRIVRIFLAGLQRKGIGLSGATYCERSDAAAARLAAEFPQVSRKSPEEVAASSSVLFIALPPPAFAEGLGPIGPALRPETLVVSLAPKFPMSAIAAMLGGHDRLARMLPNAPSAIGAGYNPISYGQALTERDRAELAALVAPLGEHPEVEERKLEAYAVLTAMGPTYFFFQYYELMRLVAGFGLDAAEVMAGARAMLEGALVTAFDSGLAPAEVLDLIPSKPLAPDEDAIKAIYEKALNGVYAKLRP